jgi:hypothetical protein
MNIRRSKELEEKRRKKKEKALDDAAEEEENKRAREFEAGNGVGELIDQHTLVFVNAYNVPTSDAVSCWHVVQARLQIHDPKCPF